MSRYFSDHPVITIRVKGPVQTGKTAIMAEIKEAIEAKGLAVVFTHREMRMNEPVTFEHLEPHELPCQSTIIALEEVTIARPALDEVTPIDREAIE